MSDASLTSGRSGETTATAYLSKGDSINAFDISFEFDGRIATIQRVCLAAGWDHVLVNSWDNVNGRARIAAFRLGAGCEPTEVCELFVASWKAGGVGRTSLSTSTVKVAGKSGDVAGLLHADSTGPAVIDVGPAR